MPTGLQRRIEDHVEVRLLAKVRQVHDPIAAHHKEPMVDGGQIRGVVAEASVALDRHERNLGDARGENAHGALALHAQAPVLQLLDQGRDHVVVERLAALQGRNAEPLVDLVERLPAHIANPLPRLPRNLAAALQVDNCLLGSFLEVLVVIESLLRGLVECVQVADIRHLAALHEVRVRLLHVLDQHAKLGAPITDMVQPVNLVAAELQDPAQGLPQDGRPQVADMHLLRDVRRREIHGHPLQRGVDVLNLGSRSKAAHLGSEPVLRQLHRDEALRRDDDLGEQLVLGQAGLDRLGHARRVRKTERLAMVLEEAHGIVALVVAELRVPLDHQRLLLDRRERRPQGLCEEGLGLSVDRLHGRHHHQQQTVPRTRVRARECTLACHPGHRLT
mmetsp:Transcript_15817/g.45095  ORF Transcript_15817/g.45095 Transcript_15817/m.45095 type:complete len:390 (-) Transcript_15817:12-1181(-)